MIIVNTSTKEILTEKQFRALFKKVSLPSDITEDDLLSLGFDVAEDNRGEPTPDGKKRVGEQVVERGGVWYIDSVFEDMSAEELSEKRKQEIQSQLFDIDRRRIRPLAEGDTDFLQALNDQAQALRAELKEL